jgi:acetyl-CoA synthetase
MARPGDDPQLARWLTFVERARREPGLGFEEHLEAFTRLAEERPAELGPMPAWAPDADRMADSNIGRMMAELGLIGFGELHRWSVERRADFWNRVVARLGIVFSSPPERILDDGASPEQPRWLPGCELNIVDSCFRASDSAVAVAVGVEGSPGVETVSYGELEALTNRFANGLREHGFAPGDGIALYMPMNLECVAAYLGAIRAGCFVVSIADSFAPHELRRRLEIGGAAGIVTVDRFDRGDRTIPLFDKVVEVGAPRAVVVTTGGDAELRTGDLRWEAFLSGDASFSSIACEPYALTNVLFSSGTTGDPKAIPWTHLTPVKCAMDGHFHHDIGPGSVVAWPTNVGWMMGPWLIYAALVNRACIALFEGAPTHPDFASFVRDAGVTMLGVVPSLVRSWRASRALDRVDWSGIEVFSSTGEPSNRSDYLWLMSRAGYRAPVIEYCGGTEIGGGYITGTVVQPASPATFSTPALGLDFVVLDEQGGEVGDGDSGEVFLVPPSIGLSQSLLNRDHEEVYHAGCPAGPNGEVLRRHGDQMERLPGGCFRAHGRADDTMNLGGIKVSSVELETVLEQHPAVAECAAVAVRPEDGGADSLVVFAVVAGIQDLESLRTEFGRLVARELNPLFKIHDVVAIDSLPRTASNKLMRRTLRSRYTESSGRD